MDKKVLTLDELADVLCVSKSYARRLAKVSGFPVIRFGLRIIVPAEALDQWLMDNVGKQIKAPQG